MAHSLLTPTIITKEALSVLHNEMRFIKTINREYQGQFAKSGAKIGTTLTIREPNQFTVRSGAVMSVQDLTESSQTLTLATQRGVDMEFSSVELTMTIDDFSNRYIKPAMSRLAAEIESIVLTGVYKDVYNLTSVDPANEPDAILDVLRANARVSQGLAPQADRHFILDSPTMFPLVNAVSTYFHKASELERAFAEGYIGMAAGVKWWESNMVPTHTAGTRTDTTPVVNTSTGITSGTATIAITGLGSTVTVKAGDVFTVVGVNAVNPETKVPYSHLQQWVITADGTASGGALTVSVSPTPTTSGAKQNISITGAGSGKAVVFAAHGGNGAASSALIQPMLYHRDAFTFVTADLEMPSSGQYARQTLDGISMRYWRSDDIVNDKHPTRLDVLFGYKTIRPEWACRVRG